MSRPAACIVTPISRDHETLFGVSGVAAIARLKAGIFREGVPAVLAEQPAIALGVLREEARRAGAPVTWAGHDWKSKWDGQAFVYEASELTAACALAWPAGPASGAECGGGVRDARRRWTSTRIKPDAMAVGLREAVWPARLQQLKPGPLAPEMGPPVWIDAAHNPGGAEVLADAIRAREPEERRQGRRSSSPCRR